MDDLKRDNPFQEMYISMLNAKPIAYISPFVGITGSITATLFLSQLLYWWGKGSNPQWIYKTIEEVKTETGLSREQQQTAIKQLIKLDILQQRNFGIPQKRHFKINHKVLGELCKQHMLNNKKTTFNMNGIIPSSEENPQTNTDSTTDTTPDSTYIDKSACTTQVVLAEIRQLEEFKKDWIKFDLIGLEEELELPLSEYIYAPAIFWQLQKDFPTLRADEIAHVIVECALSIGTNPDRIPCQNEQVFLWNTKRFLKKRLKDKEKGYY